MRVGGGEDVKYSLCFSMRKSRLLMRKRLNSDRFYSYAMLVLLCRLTIVTMTIRRTCENMISRIGEDDQEETVSCQFAGFHIIEIMLSRIIKQSLLAAFSTSNITTTVSSSSLNLAERAGVPEIQPSQARQLSDLKQITQNERKHLAYYANDLKEELNDLIKLNFESQQNQKTLIFQSTPDGTNYFKAGELLVVGSAYSLWNLLLGFPSYLALGATLGAAGLGAALSCSNFLKRGCPQITHIYTTSDKQLEIHYLKPSGIFSKTQAFFTIAPSHYSSTSFSNPLSNYLRKSNNTSWVKIDGNLFWYNSNPQSLRVNNHHLL